MRPYRHQQARQLRIGLNAGDKRREGDASVKRDLLRTACRTSSAILQIQCAGVIVTPGRGMERPMRRSANLSSSAVAVPTSTLVA
jgi:hypothetical protein